MTKGELERSVLHAGTATIGIGQLMQALRQKRVYPVITGLQVEEELLNLYNLVEFEFNLVMKHTLSPPCQSGILKLVTSVRPE